jgi:hypothetical protein
MARSPLHTRGSATSLQLLLGGFVVLVFWVRGAWDENRPRAGEPPASARIPESSYDRCGGEKLQGAGLQEFDVYASGPSDANGEASP